MELNPKCERCGQPITANFLYTTARRRGIGKLEQDPVVHINVSTCPEPGVLVPKPGQ